MTLEESRDPGFDDARAVYRGSDGATTLSGRRDGLYFYRLSPGPTGGPAPPVAEVRVEHHSLGRALTFFALGLVVFGATAALVVGGPEDTGT